MFQFPQNLLETINQDLKQAHIDCPKCHCGCIALIELKETPLDNDRQFSYRIFAQCLGEYCDYEEEL